MDKNQRRLMDVIDVAAKRLCEMPPEEFRAHLEEARKDPAFPTLCELLAPIERYLMNEVRLGDSVYYSVEGRDYAAIVTDLHNELTIGVVYFVDGRLWSDYVAEHQSSPHWTNRCWRRRDEARVERVETPAKP